MGRFQKTITALAAVATTSVLLMSAACGNISAVNAAESTGPTITVGVESNVPGLSVQQGERWSGFDVDVAQYVAHGLGYAPKEIIWKNVPIDQRAQMLDNGSVDMIVGTDAITPEHQQNVDFAGPYLIGGQQLMVTKSNTSISGVASLPGKSVCTASGSLPAQIIASTFGSKVTLVQLPTYTQCVTALLSGSVDAVTADGIVLAGLKKAKGDGYLKIVGKPFTRDDFGIAVKKNSPHLVSQINKTLGQMIRSGVWQSDFESAMAGTGYTLNDQWNKPSQLDAQDSDETVQWNGTDS